MLCRVELGYNLASFSLGRNEEDRREGKYMQKKKKKVKEMDSY